MLGHVRKQTNRAACSGRARDAPNWKACWRMKTWQVSTLCGLTVTFPLSRRVPATVGSAPSTTSKYDNEALSPSRPLCSSNQRRFQVCI